MSSPAGVVNRDGPSNDAEFEGILADHSEAVKAMARAARALVYEVLPETVEVVWPHQQSVGWGTGPKKMSEQFCYLQAFEEHIGLGFYHGSELPDPEDLFGGPSPTRGRCGAFVSCLRISSKIRLCVV